MAEEINPPAQPTIPPVPPVTPQPKTSWTIPLVLILALFSLVISGYLFWQNQNLQKQLAAISSPTPSPFVLTQSSTPAADSTASWETYNHPQNLYSFKFPEDKLILEENPIDNNPGSACKTEVVMADKKLGFIMKDKNQFILLGDIAVDVCKVSQESFPMAAFANMSGEPESKVEFNGLNAYIKTGEVDMFKIGRKDTVERFAFYKDGLQFTFELRIEPTRPNKKELFDQILSTFKFTQ
jgi:hypothetical protein